MPITDFLTRNALQYGEEVALVEINPQHQPAKEDSFKEYALVQPAGEGAYRKEMTWAEFDCQANRFANLLRAKGIREGQKVALLLMNCIEWLPLYFGILRSGALAVPLNYRYTADEIAYCLKLADAEALVFGPEFTERVAAVKDGLPQVRWWGFLGHACPVFAEGVEAELAAAGSAPLQVQLTDETDAAIYFSSGTTGFPKAILHTHKSLLHAALCEQNHHGQNRDDVFLCIPPLYHTGAKMHWFGSLVAGSPAVLLRGVSPRWILETVSRERATIVWLLVPWAQDILDAVDAGDVSIDELSLGQWRLMHIGAQPVPPSLIRRWKKVFPHHDYDTNYGLSESTGPGSVHLGIENLHKVGAIGKAGFGWQTKIVNTAGTPVKQGEVGELCVCGPGVMKCYYNDPGATAAILKDNWLHTGDMAMQDEDGFIFLVDRMKDVIIMGGENIYPVQIEDHLRAMPAVKDVAVIGLGHPRLGEIPAAIVEVKADTVCTEADVLAFCADLPRYKRPQKIIFAKVPRNPTGKIEKPKLRSMYAGGSVVEAQIEKSAGAGKALTQK